MTTKIRFVEDENEDEIEYQIWLESIRKKINWDKAKMASSIEEIIDV